VNRLEVTVQQAHVCRWLGWRSCRRCCHVYPDVQHSASVRPAFVDTSSGPDGGAALVGKLGIEAAWWPLARAASFRFVSGISPGLASSPMVKEPQAVGSTSGIGPVESSAEWHHLPPRNTYLVGRPATVRVAAQPIQTVC
jgi:hypothetical protein